MKNLKKILIVGGSSLLGIGVLILVLMLVFSDHKKNDNSPDNTEANKPQTENEKSSNEEDVLMFEGTVPCNTDINYKFRIKSDGPVNIQLAGVKGKKYFSGHGGFNVDDSNLECGMAYFTDTITTNTRIQVYKVK